MQQESVTLVTQTGNHGLQNKSPEINDVTLVTHVTHENAASRGMTPETLPSSIAADNAEQSISEGYKGYMGYNADSKTTSGVTRGEARRVTRVTKPEQPLDLETRLAAAGIFIAIDRATGSALLVFSQSDAAAVKAVATVYQSGQVTLTPEQRQELTDDLTYYERLVDRASAQDFSDLTRLNHESL